jgi:hypothetical protein
VKYQLLLLIQEWQILLTSMTVFVIEGIVRYLEKEREGFFAI